MYRPLIVSSLALTAVIAFGIPAAAATLEYTFTVPYQVRSAPTGSVATGASAGRAPAMSVSCAVGPASLGYSTSTNGAVNATGTGTTNNVTGGRATVVVTVDAEARGDVSGKSVKDGAGGILQPTKPSGYYTCWATFANGNTPVNFLQTTAIGKTSLASNAKAQLDQWSVTTNVSP